MGRTSKLLARIVGLTVLALVLWVAALATLVAIREDAIPVAGNGTASLITAAKDQAKNHEGNLALVVIDGGRVSASYFHSIGRPVDADTLFQMASVSKWITAWGVMTLVESGRIDLDVPVSRYLKRWRLPPTEYGDDQVTVRRLLSHTAGLTDGLGYCGFAPGQPLQTLPASLTSAADGCPFTNGAVSVGARPGAWQYSGGGYTLLQLLIEDVSGQSFATYMDGAVLKPLGMRRSTFQPRAAGAANVAEFFDVDGSPAQHFVYTAAAAASLYTSTADLARFLAAHRDGPNGEVPGKGVLSPKSIALMFRPKARMVGRPHWGLGVRLYALARSGGYVVGHDGGNMPAVNTAVRLDPVSGDALIALSTGGKLIAARLASAWLRQHVDEANLPDSGFSAFAVLVRLYSVRFWLAGGAAVICIIGLVGGYRAIRSEAPVRR